LIEKVLLEKLHVPYSEIMPLLFEICNNHVICLGSVSLILADALLRSLALQDVRVIYCLDIGLTVLK